MSELADFLKGTLSSDGKESFSRVGCAFIIYMLVVWTTYLVFKTDTIIDVPLQWAGLATLLFLGGKSIDAVTTIKGDNNATAIAVSQNDQTTAP